MVEKKLTVERSGHILLMGLNRPGKMNAFDVDMFVELAVALGELDADPELRCGLLFAHGRHFTAGLDLSQWAPLLEQGIFPPPLPRGACEPFGLYETSENRRVRKPMVMAVQGICFTIGLELLLGTDIRVAADDVRFAMLEIKRGIYPVGGVTIRLQREIGWGNCMRYILTGDEMHAPEAHRLGLVQELVPPGRQLESALRIAETISLQAPLAVQATLLASRQLQLKDQAKVVDKLVPELMKLMKSEDTAEGVRSFIERREARFKGK
jgi:enoyl-CoA hydratase